MSSVLTTLASSLETIAPTLATMALGPLGGTAVTAIESALGVTGNSNKPIEDRAQAILSKLQSGAMTPEQLSALRQADLTHSEKMKQLDIDLTKINDSNAQAFAQMDENDRDSARKREEIVKDSTPPRLAWLIVGANVAVIMAEVFGLVKIPSGSDGIAVAQAVGTASGYLISESKTVLAFYFGSARSALSGAFAKTSKSE